IEPQHLRQGRHVLRANAGIAGKSSGEFHDSAGIVYVVVSAGEKCGASGRTKRGGMKTVIAQAGACQFVERGHLDRSAKGARLPKADVVKQNDNDVGRSLGRLYLEPRGRFYVARIELRDGW